MNQLRDPFAMAGEDGWAIFICALARLQLVLQIHIALTEAFSLMQPISKL